MQKEKTNSLPFILITCLFFLWGFAHNLDPILIPHLKKSFTLSTTQSTLVDSSVFVAYFFMALPAGYMMQKWGYKTGIIVGLLLFALGSFVSGYSDDINIIILGRAIQGAGAISAAITALVADLTRDEHRTKAMAMIGATIGITFALSLMGAPVLNRLIGVPGIFMLTGMLSLTAILVVRFVVPTPLTLNSSQASRKATPSFKSILKNTQLSR